MQNKLLMVMTVIILILSSWLYLEHRKSNSIQQGLKPLPVGIHSIVSVNTHDMTVRNVNKVQTVTIPKFGNIEVRINDRGEAVICSTGWLPRFGLRPLLGVAWTGQLEPMAGIELMRVEPINAGLSVDVTPSVIGCALERDIYNNASIGIGTGLKYTTMQQSYYAFLSLSF